MTNAANRTVRDNILSAKSRAISITVVSEHSKHHLIPDHRRPHFPNSFALFALNLQLGERIHRRIQRKKTIQRRVVNSLLARTNSGAGFTSIRPFQTWRISYCNGLMKYYTFPLTKSKFLSKKISDKSRFRTNANGLPTIRRNKFYGYKKSIFKSQSNAAERICR